MSTAAAVYAFIGIFIMNFPQFHSQYENNCSTATEKKRSFTRVLASISRYKNYMDTLKGATV